MSLLSIGNTYQSKAAGINFNAGETAEKTAAASEEKKAAGIPNVDSFVKGSGETSEKSGVVTPKRLSSDQLKEIQESQLSSFKNMIANMMTTQADKNNAANFGITLNKELFSKITVTPQQQIEAQQAISEDGEWGVNAVAGRIMDMAVALSGGDSSKAELLRNAVDKGFKAAGVQWGSSLPSICSKTHDEINKRFDYWEENGSLDGYEYKAAETE